MPGNYFAKTITSVYGRRLGLSILSSGESGNSKKHEFLVGPDAFRMPYTTGESTATNLAPWGVSRIAGSSAASSSVFTIDPPIPGVSKIIHFDSTGDKNCYLKTANSETFQSTAGSSFTTLQSTLGGMIHLVGVTTAIWGLAFTGYAKTTST